MADNLATIAFKGLVLLFITSVVIFICFFGVLRVEQYRANNELQRRGASRYTPDGELNLWYFFVREIPKIKSLASLNYLSVPRLEQTEKGFRVIGKDYAATFERFVHPEIDHDNPDAVTEMLAKDLRRLDFDLTIVKGKTHYWKHRAAAKPPTVTDVAKENQNTDEKNPKDNDIKQSAPGNKIAE